MRSVVFLFLSLLVFGCERSTTEPEPYVPFDQRLAASEAAQTLSNRGMVPDWSQREFVTLPNGSHGVKVPLSDHGAAFLAINGDTATVTEFDGFATHVVPGTLFPSLQIESLDGSHTFSIGIGGIGRQEARITHAVRQQSGEWDEFFACVEARVDELPAWVDATCGISVLLCVFGNPLGCAGTAICAIAYLGECFIKIFG